MQLQHIRHATTAISLGGLTLLVDPMLSPARALDPVSNSPNQQRNPTVVLPLDRQSLAELLGRTNAVLLTHTHFDHWDQEAQTALPKDLPVLCQPEDAARIAESGFRSVQPIQREMEWQGVHFIRTGGQHGTGEIGRRMGPVSGFVLQADDSPRLYLAGDTIWCPEVQQALQEYQPDVVVVNAGAAQFNVGDPITMTAEDVAQVCQALPGAEIVAVHMGAINHCLLTRNELERFLQEAGLNDRVHIPEDGTLLRF